MAHGYSVQIVTRIVQRIGAAENTAGTSDSPAAIFWTANSVCAHLDSVNIFYVVAEPGSVVHLTLEEDSRHLLPEFRRASVWVNAKL